MGFQPAPVQDFIGNGITFPIQLTNGRVNIDTGFTLIRASISTILSWLQGTRFFLGEFGGSIDDLIEEPNDEITQNLIANTITNAITQWEKRVTQVSILSIQDTVESLNVTIQYQIVNTNTTDNFIYPFYKQIIY